MELFTLIAPQVGLAHFLIGALTSLINHSSSVTAISPASAVPTAALDLE